MISIHEAVATLAIVLLAPNVYGQACPQSIEVVEKVHGEIEKWDATSSPVRRFLSGIEVIEGDVHIDTSDDAILKPVDDVDGGYVWRFRSPIGSAVVWMRCIYKDSEIRLTRRLEAGVSECRQSTISPAVRGERNRIEVVCS